MCLLVLVCLCLIGAGWWLLVLAWFCLCLSCDRLRLLMRACACLRLLVLVRGCLRCVPLFACVCLIWTCVAFTFAWGAVAKRAKRILKKTPDTPRRPVHAHDFFRINSSICPNPTVVGSSIWTAWNTRLLTWCIRISLQLDIVSFWMTPSLDSTF